MDYFSTIDYYLDRSRRNIKKATQEGGFGITGYESENTIF